MDFNKDFLTCSGNLHVKKDVNTRNGQFAIEKKYKSNYYETNGKKQIEKMKKNPDHHFSLAFRNIFIMKFVSLSSKYDLSFSHSFLSLQLLESICQKRHWGTPTYELFSAFQTDPNNRGDCQLYIYKVCQYILYRYCSYSMWHNLNRNSLFKLLVCWHKIVFSIAKLANLVSK